MSLYTNYQDKATQTDEIMEEDTMEKIYKILSTLSKKMNNMEGEMKDLKATSQQHDYKYADQRRSEDEKIPELKGAVGKLPKTHNICLDTATGTNKGVSEKRYANTNLNKVFDKPFMPKTAKDPLFVPPQTTTYSDSLNQDKKAYNHINRLYIENIHKSHTFLITHPRSSTTEKPTEDYITQKLQGYNKLIAQPKTNANLVRTCYSYGLLNTVYTYDRGEISVIPKLHKAFMIYKRITRGNLFFIKFYTAPAEILFDEIKSVIQIIKIGLT